MSSTTSPRHPIRVVVQRTGLKPELIRAWERRHGAIAPRRTSGRHRLYSDDDIERLILLRQATGAGHSIGQIARLDHSALTRLTSGEGEEPVVERPAGFDRRIESCLEVIRALDGDELSARLEESLVEMGPARSLTDMVVPLLETVGERWHRGELRTMHEHLATSTIRSFVDRQVRRHRPRGHAPSLVATTPAGQRHEIGALLAGAMAAIEGWRVLYLGADLPSEDIAAAAHAVDAHAVALSIVHPADDPALGMELLQLHRHLGSEIAVLVGGRARDAYRSYLDEVGAVRMGALEQMPSMLHEIRNQGRQRRGGVDASGNGRSSAPPCSAELGHGRWLQISHGTRRRYGLEDLVMERCGALSLESLPEVRELAWRLSRGNDNGGSLEPRAGLLFALGLLQDFAHRLVDSYRAEKDPQVWSRALDWLRRDFGDRLDRALGLYWRNFRAPSAEDSGAAAAPEPDLALEGLFLLWLTNSNPALASLRDLFSDRELHEQTGYRHMMRNLEGFFEHQPGYGPDNESLYRILRAPAVRSPDFLPGQLELLQHMRQRAAGLYTEQLLAAQDVLREEEQPVFVGPGGPPPEVKPFEESALFPSPFVESPWMASVVLVAKNVFVWLDQLSRSQGREITRLDQIPDTELDRLRSAGINGLWLIGCWQRSPASRRIKELTGQPRTEASAYSLAAYRIDERLGGEPALESLARRAADRGLRLAGDFVPNHMGIDSRWVIEHPERFVSVSRPPFPGYRFSGEDLSDDPRVGIFLEDHYLDQSDAAVVFKRMDRTTGEERYVYHGNDGTSLPWNDTAQLDYLVPEVREHMIVLLVELAQRFPILRIDAAMTLVKQHVQRLWYPAPGQGGAIPSRSEAGLGEEEFERRMPEEFWREAVARVAAEAPDCLLMAEGFWMMEGYFVRQLGMPRVYNSAFMHLLRDEETAQYRQQIQHALNVDRSILGRFVNFLTNPDEAPAASQLGRGDKYFALCALLVTLPGLPLFGHGQIEGLEEQYGMDYDRALLDEEADEELLLRHGREIRPLLERRQTFAATEGFRLLESNAEPAEGEALRSDDVLAFCNGKGSDPVLVVVHNRSERGTVRLGGTTPFLEDGDSRCESLADALGLPVGDDVFWFFRDLRHGLEYLISTAAMESRGPRFELGPYGSLVFGDFRALFDATGRCRLLAQELEGRGAEGLAARLPGSA